MRARALACTAILLGAGSLGAQVVSRPARAALAPSHLAVRDNGTWHTWWRSDRAPVAWNEPAFDLAAHVAWRAAGPAVQWGEMELAGSGEAWRTRVIVARIDPRRARLTLDTAFADGRAAWSIERAPATARMAVNAGQFALSMPWGLVVLGGHRYLPQGYGPLSSAVLVGADGAVHWIAGDTALRSITFPVAYAFQSYPTLLAHDSVPPALRAPGAGVDLAHRDARLALGRMRDGRLVIALTRFDAAGGALGFVPFGLTIPEMAAVMGALGARDAVALDGGISAQLLVRDDEGAHAWPGVRKVPLALLVFDR
ncbi:MAG TPA: phosphodiester glycosidase family protein [Gemmatimonadaceae bacterium]|nr:phosphodiester glycosidase family protein [Gemmatimonadaceae bacterium]